MKMQVFFVLGFLLSSGLARLQNSHLKRLEVKDVDFENTKVSKVCLMAKLNATLIVHQKGTDASEIIIPQDLTTDGSYCNDGYYSSLCLRFEGHRLEMKFVRDSVAPSHPKKTTYCDHCNYGTWKLSGMTLEAQVEPALQIHAALSEELHNNAHELFEGIEIKRSFKCEIPDRLIEIPFRVTSVLNTTSHRATDAHSWTARIRFYSLQIQPFLVFSEHFNDPYLCRDVIVSHVLVITIPIVYFIIFILFYRVKAEYGCPPWKNWSSRPKRIPVPTEESTNIMSDEFSTMQIGLSSTTTGF